jgi:hypothetical protein
LSIALYGVFQLGCHLEHILLTIRLTIKSRMPVILRPEDEEQWLDASRTTNPVSEPAHRSSTRSTGEKVANDFD